MIHFELIQAVIEAGQHATGIGELEAAFRSVVKTLGFRHYACCAHVDPLHPPPGAVVMHNYPLEWVRQVSERRLYYVDPVLRRADLSPQPFFWDSDDFQASLTRKERQILNEAARYGIAHGFTTPIHSPPSHLSFRASCSVAPASPLIDARSYRTVHLLSFYVYRVATALQVSTQRITPDLTVRELQCLEFTASGQKASAMAESLKISPRTVRKHMGSAMRKLGASTSTQAVVEALANRQISFGDVVKRRPPR